MRNILGWMKQPQARQTILPTRRRIDLGDEPADYPIYAIGDVHGCLIELQRAEARIAADIRRTGRVGLVVLLGDYVDRGPASAQVIEHLQTPSALGLRRLALCGNHDDIFAKFILDPARYVDWLSLGGDQTLRSYGVDPRQIDLTTRKSAKKAREIVSAAVPASHQRFLINLPICLKIGKVVFVHAGIKPRVAMLDQEDEDLMWIREPFLTEGPAQPLLVVHGHTPQAKPDPGPGRIGIDTCAYASGNLTVLKIDGDEKWII